MRVLVLLTDAFGGHGGIALYNRDLLTALCADPDCREVVAIPRLMPHASEPQPDKLTYITEGLNSTINYLRVVWSTVRRDPNFQLIICGHVNLLPVAYAIRLWLRVPLILEIYGIDAWKPRGKFLSDILVSRIDGFISISAITRERFLSWAKVPIEKGFLLPNAIHLERYGPGPKDPALLKRYGLDGKVVLMTLGRLVSQERYKGFDEVLAVLPEIAEEIPNIAYIIAGSGNDRPRLEEMARSLGLTERVVFTGFVREEEKADHFRLADVYIMPSQGEGFGFVFLEAMACGIPVIASKLDGGREAVMDGELGKLVDPSNTAEIKAATLEALKRGCGLAPAGLDYFSFSNFSKRLSAILQKVNTVE